MTLHCFAGSKAARLCISITAWSVFLVSLLMRLCSAASTFANSLTSSSHPTLLLCISLETKDQPPSLECVFGPEIKDNKDSNAARVTASTSLITLTKAVISPSLLEGETELFDSNPFKLPKAFWIAFLTTFLEADKFCLDYFAINYLVIAGAWPTQLGSRVQIRHYEIGCINLLYRKGLERKIEGHPVKPGHCSRIHLNSVDCTVAMLGALYFQGLETQWASSVETFLENQIRHLGLPLSHCLHFGPVVFVAECGHVSCVPNLQVLIQEEQLQKHHSHLASQCPLDNFLYELLHSSLFFVHWQNSENLYRQKQHLHLKVQAATQILQLPSVAPAACEDQRKESKRIRREKERYLKNLGKEKIFRVQEKAKAFVLSSATTFWLFPLREGKDPNPHLSQTSHECRILSLKTCHITNLTCLDLSSNNFGGHIPLHYLNLQHLIYLDHSGNNFLADSRIFKNIKLYPNFTT
ncbi:hypothetical protein F8388_007173 [Cannabis sativa]|uniref:Uncharacterized protein n=1 Tax=Cannabis sativa TaxID=3483 RepID=A0A7J6EGQ9_CANSA|nr:hypothetical protein F8388_007173 [Cannabis sativa]KAF4368316.1 hypothetical protein G4B88_008620 [Cannabis sativa]